MKGGSTTRMYINRMTRGDVKNVMNTILPV